MDGLTAAARRRLIARKSPIQREVDDRPACEDCGKPLTDRDFKSYWDGCPDLGRAGATPRCCEDCAEVPGG